LELQEDLEAVKELAKIKAKQTALKFGTLAALQKEIDLSVVDPALKAHFARKVIEKTTKEKPDTEKSQAGSAVSRSSSRARSNRSESPRMPPERQTSRKEKSRPRTPPKGYESLTPERKKKTKSKKERSRSRSRDRKRSPSVDRKRSHRDESDGEKRRETKAKKKKDKQKHKSKNKRKKSKKRKRETSSDDDDKSGESLIDLTSPAQESRDSSRPQSVTTPTSAALRPSPVPAPDNDNPNSPNEAEPAPQSPTQPLEQGELSPTDFVGTKADSPVSRETVGVLAPSESTNPLDIEIDTTESPDAGVDKLDQSPPKKRFKIKRPPVAASDCSLFANHAPPPPPPPPPAEAAIEKDPVQLSVDAFLEELNVSESSTSAAPLYYSHPPIIKPSTPSLNSQSGVSAGPAIYTKPPAPPEPVPVQTVPSESSQAAQPASNNSVKPKSEKHKKSKKSKMPALVQKWQKVASDVETELQREKRLKEQILAEQLKLLQ